MKTLAWKQEADASLPSAVTSLGTSALLCFLGCSEQDAIGRVGSDRAYERCYFHSLVLSEAGI